MNAQDDRARLLTAARDEFAAHGYREASTDRIAARAGLTPDAVSAAFPGKQALYFAALTTLHGAGRLAAAAPGFGEPQTVVEACEMLLRAAFPAGAWPGLQLVHDDTGELAAAVGLPSGYDTTQFAVRISEGRIVARAEGYGAGHAAASR